MIPRLIPGIRYGPLPRVASVSGLLTWPPKLIVLHDTGHLKADRAIASAWDEARYSANRDDPQERWTSCHAFIDETGPIGSTPLDVVCWAAYNWANHHCLHFEMCGQNAGVTGQVPAATIAHTARLTATTAALAGIALVKRSVDEVRAIANGTSNKTGICGHWDITRALGVGDHDDPGPNFDWAAFIAAANGANSMADDALDVLINEVLGGSLSRRNALYYWIRGMATGKVPTQTADGLDWTKMVDAPFPALPKLADQLATIALDAKAAASLSITVTMTPEDLAGLRAGLKADLGADIAALGVKLDQVLVRLAAAGHGLAP